ncbi:MAG: hypothetical protein V3R98_14115 [Alphaproteobacteria bacterium]
MLSEREIESYEPMALELRHAAAGLRRRQGEVINASAGTAQTVASVRGAG